MIADLVLNNAKTYFENDLVDCSLAVSEGKILRIGKEASMPKAVEKTDLKGFLVLPGLIDAHVHLRDEGKAYKEDFESGTAAAASGGFTTVLDMPNNCPVTMDSVALKNRIKIAEKKTLVNVAFYSEFPKELGEIRKILKEGAIAFKLFLAEQVGGLNIDDDNCLAAAFKILGKLGVPLAVHAEDKTLLRVAEEKLKRDNQHDVQAFLDAHSENVEVKAIERVLGIARKHGTKVHVCHLSTIKGLDAVCNEKREQPITCEVAPHNLLLSSIDLKREGTLAITMPPIREKRFASALWNGVKTGCIDIIASDHAPHTVEEKRKSNVWDVKVGIPGLETTLPLFLTEVNRGRLALGDLVRLMAEKPAEIFSLKHKGHIRKGYDADLTVVDLKRTYEIDAAKFRSKARYSPFGGWKVKGRPVKTFVNGLLVMDEGEIVAKLGSGKVVRRGS